MKKQVVYSGIDVIKADEGRLKRFEKARLALATNPTGLDKNFNSTIDIINEKYKLAALFAPEHGVRGNLQAGEQVESGIDWETGVPVYSLYGQSPHIPLDAMAQFDAVVFDIQDVGARFYTYLYTLSYIMEDCAAANKPVIVLDRVNPISCEKIQGSVLDPEFKSFVGRYPIATRTGLTIGEFARYINSVFSIGCDLTVIPCEGYNRQLYMDETDISYVSPSPNLPTVESCLCYIGTCIFEGTNLSEGRGTTRPFELIGAPWLNGKTGDIIKSLSGEIHGARLKSAWFTPSFSKHSGALCEGISIHIKNRDEFDPFLLGISLLSLIKNASKEFEFLPPSKENGKPFIDLLLGSDAIRKDDVTASNFTAGNFTAGNFTAGNFIAGNFIAGNFIAGNFIESQKGKLLDYKLKTEPFLLYE